MVAGDRGQHLDNAEDQELGPFAGFGFEALSLTSVKLGNKDLTPLADCLNLRYLACARLAPRASFDELKALRPDISRSWFDRYEIRPVAAASAARAPVPVIRSRTKRDQPGSVIVSREAREQGGGTCGRNFDRHRPSCEPTFPRSNR